MGSMMMKRFERRKSEARTGCGSDGSDDSDGVMMVVMAVMVLELHCD